MANEQVGYLNYGAPTRNPFNYEKFQQIQRLVAVQRVWASVAHVAKRTAARALVAHDHEGGRAVAEALTDVGARGFFANGYQFVGTQDVFDFTKARIRRTGFDTDPFRLFQGFAAVDHFDWNA